VNQVWSSDITYVPLARGWLYLTAVLDWFSRKVLSWQLSNTLDGAFCLAALEESLQGARPEVFNTDQGCQFTARAYTSRLAEAGVSISMDGRGRALDNVFIERLWRSVKHEEVYLRGYESVGEAEASLGLYFAFYNERRRHQSLGYRTPAAVYAEGDSSPRHGRVENSKVVRNNFETQTVLEECNGPRKLDHLIVCSSALFGVELRRSFDGEEAAGFFGVFQGEGGVGGGQGGQDAVGIG
jgi:hypothetical protein